MPIDNLIFLIISLCLESWLLVLLFRREVRRHFPVFFFFTLICLPVTVARLVTTTNYTAYFFVYWWSNAVVLLLGLAALHEVFHWVYEGFYRIRWFRVLYYAAILLVLFATVRYAAVNPPVQAHPVIGLLLEMEITINLLQVAIVALFGALVKPLDVEFRRYPFGIASGFGVAAMGALFGYLSRSIFGTKLDIFTRYTSAVAYILALLIWIMAFSRQEPAEKAWTPPMPPDKMLRMAREYLKVLRPRRKDK